MGVRLECAIPILRVEDLPASLRWYTGVLDFSIDWQAPGDDGHPVMASVSRDRKTVMLCEGAQGHVGGWVWLGVDGDIEALHEDLKAKGADVSLPPTSFSWAYEIRVKDPDGNVLRFGGEPRNDLPFRDAEA